ncbi:MAG: hypothetical protein SWJ54_12695 [Cyanobacteriota bacterium]|nr:hypothetical protein [Cyanobacteriota bacterium]
MNIKHLFATVVTLALTATPVLAQSGSWVYTGQASTGESIYVHSSSIRYNNRNNIDFTYKIGNEVIRGTAYCQENRWYASGYGTYSPSSRGTQSMMNYVCGR